MSTTSPNTTATSPFATETEIYLTADGQVIIADLPGELIELPWSLGQVEPCEIFGLENLARTGETTAAG